MFLDAIWRQPIRQQLHLQCVDAVDHHQVWSGDRSGWRDTVWMSPQSHSDQAKLPRDKTSQHCCTRSHQIENHHDQQAVTWIVCTTLLVSSNVDMAVHVMNDWAPRWKPRTRRPSRRYCSTGSQNKSRQPWTATTTQRDRAFPTAASRMWNSLPLRVTSTPSLETFKKRLKPFLFSPSFLS